jgi:hypothetical protein
VPGSSVHPWGAKIATLRALRWAVKPSPVSLSERPVEARPLGARLWPRSVHPYFGTATWSSSTGSAPPVAVAGSPSAPGSPAPSAGHRDPRRIQVAVGLRNQGGEPLRVADLPVAALELDVPVRRGRRSARRERGLRPIGGRGRGLEPARGVRERVVAVAGEPVRVPAVQVAAVALVGVRLPVVLVVPEPVEHHDQALLRGPFAREREVDVERRAVEARHRAGADRVAARVGRALEQLAEVRRGGGGARCGAGQEGGYGRRVIASRRPLPIVPVHYPLGASAKPWEYGLAGRRQ